MPPVHKRLHILLDTTTWGYGSLSLVEELVVLEDA
jgi:hypothetical protein